ncbi:hypothetical protein F4803DRAFT_548746 [Xylaria telfairii]|nr:hypothetical protein F4803DRAFT_548746 [Xylaria telfairii]
MIIPKQRKAVEGTEYQCMSTSPYILYALYIHKDHPLLVPREVDKKHPKFPVVPDPAKRFTLRLSDLIFREYTEK